MPPPTRAKGQIVAKAIAQSTSVSIFDNLLIGELVDQLGHAKAEAAEIKAREDALKAALIGCGVTDAEGVPFPRHSLGNPARDSGR
jgi:hypothetical protein